jgi:hypothetical protein
MGDRNFKQIGKLQFAVEVPVDSDLMLAIKLAKEKRDKTLEELCELIKQGILRENKEKIDTRINVILEQNESIKLMEDAAIAVRLYKLEEKKPENNG